MATNIDSGHERHATDSGHTGDKIKVSDPAAAPVQTDAESSGVPTPLAEALDSVRRLVEEAAGRDRPDTFGAYRQPADAAYQKRLGRQLMLWNALLWAMGLLAAWAGWPD